MKPYLFGFQSYFLFWLVAAFFGIAGGMRLTRRAGLPAGASFVALCLLAVSILVGSKLLFLVEHSLYPLDDPDPMAQNTLRGFWHGFRIPGGLLLMAPVLPLVARALRLPTLKLADAALPAAGLATGFVRVGCFLNGCCFGRITGGPFGIRFPSGARAWEWQLVNGYITPTDAWTLPVIPLQLYFAALGFLMYVLGQRWMTTKRYDGQVWLSSYLLFFGATFVLEFVRAPTPLHLNLILTGAVVVVTALIGVRTRPALPAAARVAS